MATGRQLEELEREEAKERQRRSKGRGRKGSEDFPTLNDSGKSRDKVGEAVGMSGPTYEKAKKVIEAAENDPGLTEVVEEMDRTGKVDPAYRKVAGKSKKPQPKEADSATQALWLVEDALAEVGKLAEGTVRGSLTAKLKAIEGFLKEFFKL